MTRSGLEWRQKAHVRKRKMKSGFYHIAAKANIPIVMFSFDYDHKTVHCLGYLTPSGNYDEDLAKIFERYEGKISPKNRNWLAEPLQNLVKKPSKIERIWSDGPS